MKYKTSELEGELLDAAVALALGAEYVIVNGEGCHALASQQETPGLALYGCQIDRLSAYRKFRPSTDWSDGGPIIERDRIKVEPHCADDPEGWDLESATEDWYAEHPCDCAFGPTPLIAAMRAYVASKLGEEVEL